MSRRKPRKKPSLDTFTREYIEAAIEHAEQPRHDWDATPSVGYDARDVDPATLEKMVADCAKFQERHPELLGPDAGFQFYAARNDFDCFEEDHPGWGVARSYGAFKLRVWHGKVFEEDRDENGNYWD
jgi:hypothetical protein